MTSFKKLLILPALASILAVHAEDFTMDYSARFEANGGSGEFAPYYINSLRHGDLTSARGAGIEIDAHRNLDLSRRFSYSFGLTARASAQNGVDYSRFNLAEGGWETRSLHPAPVTLRQLWGEVKFRGVFLLAGMRDFSPAFVNPRLSSGDLIESGNSRNIPQARIGFIDFQNIPFTNGWVQIQGEVAYARATDGKWQNSHYNYASGHINNHWWYNYKRCFFRTKPSQPFSITIGLQASAQFGGDVYWYDKGIVTAERSSKVGLKTFAEIMLLKNDESYYMGNHLGAWEFHARYRFRNNSQVRAYFQWLWEDGSGIGKLNGMDGLWGLEWKAANPKATVSGAVLEVITFMNHGGPIHYSPSDYTNPTLAFNKAEGADNYYNNHETNGYALYGMGIGSPMFPSPIYNTHGETTQYLNNRLWGIHGAVEGNLSPRISYRVMASYRRFFGTPFVPAINPTHCVSAFAEAKWQLPQVPGLTLGAQLGLDYGNSTYGRNFGALVSATYSGLFNFSTRKSTPTCAL